jgi:hypothetical protein
MSVKGLGSPAGKEPKSESLFLIGVHTRSFPPLTENGIFSNLPVLTVRWCTLVASTFAFPSSASPDYTNRGPLWVAGF